MDFPIKLAIGLFIFCLLLLFFRATKQMSKNYLEEHMKNRVDIDEIMSRQYEQPKIETESQQPFDIPLNHLDSLNPDDIQWVVNN